MMQLWMGVNGRNMTPALIFFIFSSLYVLKEKQKKRNSEQRAAVSNAFSRQGLFGKYDWAPTMCQAVIMAREMRVLDADRKQSI